MNLSILLAISTAVTTTTALFTADCLISAKSGKDSRGSGSGFRGSAFDMKIDNAQYRVALWNDKKLCKVVPLEKLPRGVILESGANALPNPQAQRRRGLVGGELLEDLELQE
ncbi:hypothetical protein PspLS_09049 [Pyricularia sp. CBS 133598]|nr:hypothetical protein PspLS_09049 [Pyricularia sp. CBS 133598]